MDLSSSAPNMIPFFPFSRLLPISIGFVVLKIRLLVCHHLACILYGCCSWFFTTEHFGYSSYTLFIRKLPYIGLYRILHDLLVNKEMCICFSGNLWLVRNRDHLPFLRQVLHNNSHLPGSFTGYTGINFIKDERGEINRLGNQRLNGKH